MWGIADGEVVGYEQCENDQYSEDGIMHSEHNTYMRDKSYKIACPGSAVINSTNSSGEFAIYCKTNSCPCVSLITLLTQAMEQEAGQLFDPAMWAPTFPRRVAEHVERYRRAAAAALADELPPVLIGIVVYYYM
jgi:hypothetical protein